MIWYTLTEDQRITNKNVEEKLLHHPNVSLPPSPSLRAKIAIPPQRGVFKKLRLSQEKGGGGGGGDAMNAHTNFNIFKNSLSLSSSRLTESLQWLLLHLFDSELRLFNDNLHYKFYIKLNRTF